MREQIEKDFAKKFLFNYYEHAYFTDDSVNRGSDIDAVMKNLDWKVVEKRFETVHGTR